MRLLAILMRDRRMSVADRRESTSPRYHSIKKGDSSNGGSETEAEIHAAESKRPPVTLFGKIGPG